MDYFQKILETQAAAPRMSLSNMNSVNSEYTMHCADNKNCYLLIGSERDEDCLYGNWIYECKDCSDDAFLFKCELCYESLDCEHCYGCDFCQDCTTCSDCAHCYDCKACQNCFGCVGLRNKKFHIFNEACPKEEYSKKIAELTTKNGLLIPESAQTFEKLQQKTPRLYAHIADNENCTGDYLYHSQNSFHCFDNKQLQDCFYMTSSIECRDCVDCSNIYFGCELCYEIMSAIQIYNCNYCNFCYYNTNLEYCEYLFHCKNCFGCFFLQHKEYYIFNEPYSEKDYHQKVAEIKQAMQKDGTYGKHLPALIPFEASAVPNYFPG